MSRVDNLNRILRGLQTGSPDVEASALISEDGLMIASALPQHVDDTRVAGMSATLSSLGARAASAVEGELLEIRKGSPLLTMSRTAFDNSGRAVEYGQHVYRPDLYSFELTLVDR